MRITPEYIEQNRQLHENPEYGTSASHHAEKVMEIAYAADAREILDYGCGKNHLNRCLPHFIVRGYDPAIETYSREPKPHHMVACIDVLEHIEPDCMDEVIKHIAALTERVAYLSICTKEAKKTLPDGRNAHLSVHPSEWWRNKLSAYFDITVEMEAANHYVAIATPCD